MTSCAGERLVHVVHRMPPTLGKTDIRVLSGFSGFRPWPQGMLPASKSNGVFVWTTKDDAYKRTLPLHSLRFVA